jgi:hypothetical protein
MNHAASPATSMRALRSEGRSPVGPLGAVPSRARRGSLRDTRSGPWGGRVRTWTRIQGRHDGLKETARGSGSSSEPCGEVRIRRERHETSTDLPWATLAQRVRINHRTVLSRSGIVSRVLAVALVAAALPTVPAAAQVGPGPILIEGVEEMDFDRPESWAMKYFTSLSIMTGLGTPEPSDPGSVELAVEGGIVPNLGEEKRRVGFVGSKVEDLNRTKFFGRLRATIGLPSDFSLAIGVTPPIEVGGVTPRLLSVAIARPVLDSSSWRLGLRLHGLAGTIEGDLTCPEDIAGLPDPELNPDLCLEPSNDELTTSQVGLELSATPKIWGDRWEPYFAASVNYLDLEFRVRARYSVFVDRMRLLTDGYTYSLAAGVGYRLSENLRLSGELFYTPLDVVRDPLQGTRNDELVNGRILVGYSIRD